MKKDLVIVGLIVLLGFLFITTGCLENNGSGISKSQKCKEAVCPISCADDAVCKCTFVDDYGNEETVTCEPKK